MGPRLLLACHLFRVRKLVSCFVAHVAGTLTQNKLSLNEPILIGGQSSAELNFHAALASKRDGSQDAIDFCICNAVTPEDK